MSGRIVTLLDAITDKECHAYTSAIATNPREIFDAHTETIDQMEFNSMIETKAGSFEFRNINGVSKTTLPEWDFRRFTPSIGNPHIDVDIPLWDAMMNNSNTEAGNILVRMKQAILDGAYDMLGKQFYYGQSVKDRGIDGLQKQVVQDLCFDGGGKTDGSLTSIYFIRWGKADVSIVYGGGAGKNFTWSEFQDRLVQTSKGEATHKWSYLRMYPMVTIARPNCVARICNVGEQVTDGMVMKALAQCAENGFVPDCIYMRPMTLEKLRSSRTATNPTGSEAPTPDRCGNIPIHETLSIANNEALETKYSAL